jgi:hypothetical protein
MLGKKHLSTTGAFLLSHRKTVGFGYDFLTTNNGRNKVIASVFTSIVAINEKANILMAAMR